MPLARRIVPAGGSLAAAMLCAACFAPGTIAPWQVFLAENAKRAGVATTASGMQYEVLASGAGDTPGPRDTVTIRVQSALATVTVHYGILFVDERVSDSSDERVSDSSAEVANPFTAPLHALAGFAGWAEALQLMRVGDKWKLFIPPDLAFGEHGIRRNVGPSETTQFFVIELLAVQRG